MEVGLILGTGQSHYQIDIDMIKMAEQAGFSSVWTSEAWGADAISAASWILAQTTKIKVGTAICQMPARTPALMATTSITLQHLSGGRFILGLGASGPQVVEGWHGVPYGKPIPRTREYVEIIKKIMAREAPLTHEGEHYTIPLTGEGTTGLGKPLKTILHSRYPLKIYSASISPGGVRSSAQHCDGVIPVYMDPDHYGGIQKYVDQGLEKADGEKTMNDFDVAPFVAVIQDDDIEKARAPVRENMGFYIGGMGARNKNYYADYARRLGFEEAADKIQDAFLAGRKAEAYSHVPNELIDRVALVGPKARIKEQLQRWKTAGDERRVHAMLCRVNGFEAAQTLAEEMM